MPTRPPPMNYTPNPKNGTVMDSEKSQTIFKRHVVKCADLLYRSVFITKNTSFTYIPPYNSKQNVTLKIRYGCVVRITVVYFIIPIVKARETGKFLWIFFYRLQLVFSLYFIHKAFSC